MGDILFIDEQYLSMKTEVPDSHRGYLYLLKECLDDNGTTYDLAVGYETIVSAESFLENPTDNDLKRILLFKHPDAPLRSIPFIKFGEITPEHMNYSEMEEVYKRTSIEDFLWMGRNLGFICNRGTIEDCIPAYEKTPIHSIKSGQLTEEELEKIYEQREFLKEHGCDLGYWDHLSVKNG